MLGGTLSSPGFAGGAGALAVRSIVIFLVLLIPLLEVAVTVISLVPDSRSTVTLQLSSPVAVPLRDRLVAQVTLAIPPLWLAVPAMRIDDAVVDVPPDGEVMTSETSPLASRHTARTVETVVEFNLASTRRLLAPLFSGTAAQL